MLSPPAVVSLALLFPGQTPIEFNRDVRPILSDACFTCHGPDKARRKGGLRLDTAEGRSALTPGQPDRSDLIDRVATADPAKRMPPPKAGRALTDREVDILRRWIAQGGTWEAHWSFVPPRRPAVPAVRDGGRRNPIDRFVLARLDREGLRPAPEAPATSLLRRVSLDLTGLPPTPDEVDSFLNDARPGAYERAVDRLLASPRFGERMAMDWLDAARYADSNGYQQDSTRTLWPWRDWVIQAFNDNLAYDRFTVEQLAGDLLPGATVAQKVATGFHRNHPLNGEGGRVAEESRIDYVVDRVDTTAAVWMGLTLGFARCHDHKYDPFTMKEYYSLFAYFNNVAESGSVDRGGNAAPVLAVPTADQARQLEALGARVAALEARVRDGQRAAPAAEPGVRVQTLTALLGRPAPLPLAGAPGTPLDAARRELAAEKSRREAVSRAVVSTMVMEERKDVRATHILLRGAWDKPGERMAASVLTGLAPAPAGAAGDRLGLARWLVAPGHPLAARVAVNRVWQQIHGAGLVRTPEDFGVQGEAPTHPELLDWLAVEYREGGWDTKRLLRLMVTSATYRQSSRVTPPLLERDPDNRLLARAARYRLSSLTLRDGALAAGGLLAERLGGPPVRPYQPPGLWEELSFGRIRYEPGRGEDLYRRSLYTFWRRTVGPANLFDVPARQVCVVRPSRTNTPLHALVTLNDPTYVEAARALAQRVLRAPGGDEARLTLAFRLATARAPTDRELAVLRGTLTRLRKQYAADRAGAGRLLAVGESPADTTLDPVELAAYSGVASLLLNLDEVVTRE